MRNILEKDWKKLRAMKDTVLNIACERILEKVKRIIEKAAIPGHILKKIVEEIENE